MFPVHAPAITLGVFCYQRQFHIHIRCCLSLLSMFQFSSFLIPFAVLFCPSPPLSSRTQSSKRASKKNWTELTLFLRGPRSVLVANEHCMRCVFLSVRSHSGEKEASRFFGVGWFDVMYNIFFILYFFLFTFSLLRTIANREATDMNKKTRNFVIVCARILFELWICVISFFFPFPSSSSFFSLLCAVVHHRQQQTAKKKKLRAKSRAKTFYFS